MVVPLFRPGTFNGESRSPESARHGCLTSIVVLLMIVVVAIFIGVMVLVHDDHAAVAPLPPTDYSIAVSCCTVNRFGDTVAVGTLHRLIDRGDYNLGVVGRFYNARTGQYIGNGGYSVWAPTIGSTLALPVTSTTPLPKVALRATITLTWDNPQPFSLAPW